MRGGAAAAPSRPPSRWGAGAGRSGLAGPGSARAMQQGAPKLLAGEPRSRGQGAIIPPGALARTAPQQQQQPCAPQVAAAALLERLLESGEVDAESLLEPKAGAKAPKRWEVRRGGWLPALLWWGSWFSSSYCRRLLAHGGG